MTKEKKSSTEMAQKYLDGNKNISLRDIDQQCELEWFNEKLDKYSKGNRFLMIPVGFVLFIVYLFKF